MKKEITLRFPSSEELWRFWNELPYVPSKVSLQSKTITYRLKIEEINLAIDKYNAKIVDSLQVKQH